MKKIRKWMLIAVLLSQAVAFGQSWSEPTVNGITIAAPAAAIPAGPSVQLSVTGLADTELAGTTVSVNPSVGVSVVPAKGWDNKPILLFGATQGGKYTVTLTLHAENEFRIGVTQALATARDPKLSPELLAEYDTFAAAYAKKLAEKYPFKSGFVLVEVAGPVPNPPQPPKPDPIPVTAGKRLIVIIHEQTDDTAKLSDLFVKLRHPAGEVSKYLKEKGHLLDILDQMNVNQRWLAAAGDKPLPVLIIADAVSSAVLSVEPLNVSMSPVDLITKLKATGG